jgi:hypothetical protein
MQSGLVFSSPESAAGESAGPELSVDYSLAWSALTEASEDAVLGLDLQGVIRSWICMGRSADAVEVAVSDRGPGFDAGLIGGSGLGIAGMKERLRQIGGVLQILADATGTAVTATVPTAR